MAEDAWVLEAEAALRSLGLTESQLGMKEDRRMQSAMLCVVLSQLGRELGEELAKEASLTIMGRGSSGSKGAS